MQARILLDHDTVHATANITEIREALETGKKIWIELERPTPEAEALLAGTLKLHPLTLEDIWQQGSQPKIDDYPDRPLRLARPAGPPSSPRRRAPTADDDPGASGGRGRCTWPRRAPAWAVR